MTRRTLLLMRHAKSSWDGGFADHERPLNARGQRDAGDMARRMREQGWWPEHVFASDSERTLETLLWMNEALGEELPVSPRHDLYLPSVSKMIGCIAAVDSSLQCVMMLSHNPSCEDLIVRLTGESERMTTANIARISAPAGLVWGEAAARPGEWTLDGILRPRPPRVL